jgi:DNA-binding SARP family transcriptional activator
MAVYLQILGPLRVAAGDSEVDAGPRQQRCLLALLLARAGNPISMTGLIELLWGPDPPPSAVNVIHKYVGALRRLLEPGLPPRAPGSFLVRHGNGYRFTAGPETLDLLTFRRLVAEAKESAGRDELDEALDRYAAALRLVHGPAGEGLADTPAAQATLASLDGEFFDAVVTAAEVAVRLRRPSRLLAPLRRAAEMDPLGEFVQACLVTTLAAAGHQAEALTAYRSIRGRLARELGIAPGRDLQEAYQGVLTESGPGAPVRAAQLPPDLRLFTGRRAELAALHRLRDRRRTGPLVVALAGVAGAGKSTLAVHFAHLVAGDFPDGQFYLDLWTKPPDAIQSLLHGLGVRTPDLPDTFDARVGAYRSLTAGKRVLILLDNVRDAAQVRPLLPSSAGSLVLITSRPPLLDLAARVGAHLMRVEVPDRRTARELLERRLADLPQATHGADLVEEIVELGGRSPLTLSLLAARLTAHPSLSMAAVAAELRATSPRRLAEPAG